MPGTADDGNGPYFDMGADFEFKGGPRRKLRMSSPCEGTQESVKRLMVCRDRYIAHGLLHVATMVHATIERVQLQGRVEELEKEVARLSRQGFDDTLELMIMAGKGLTPEAQLPSGAQPSSGACSSGQAPQQSASAALACPGTSATSTSATRPVAPSAANGPRQVTPVAPPPANGPPPAMGPAAASASEPTIHSAPTIPGVSESKSIEPK